MVDLMKFAIWESYAIVLGLAGVIALRLWTGEIRTRGLIEGRTPMGASYLSTSRVQLLIATLAAAAQYLIQVRQNPHAMPDVPRSWLVMLGASHVLYLGNKFQGKRKGSFQI